MDKVVSIIIPAYNAEKYIEQCVKSVINQTYKHLEIIIVNDGSKDNTLDILEKLKSTDERIVLINQMNKGLPAARNTGLKKCSGDFIFFLDSDDWIERECIEILIEIEKENEVDIVFFDYFKSFNDREIEHHIYGKNFKYCNEQTNEFLLWDMRTITAWGKLYSKECIGTSLYDEKMKTAEDVDFNYRVYKNVKTVFFTKKCLLHYRILEQSAIHGYDANVKNKFQYPLSKIASYMKTNNERDLKAYYSFAAISYIVICQNGVVRNDKISNTEKKRQIMEISKEEWVKDLFQNMKYVSIPLSRKIIVWCSKQRMYLMMLIAVGIRRRLKK